MNTLFKKFLAATMLLILTATPLWAQSNGPSPIGPGASTPATSQAIQPNLSTNSEGKQPSATSSRSSMDMYDRFNAGDFATGELRQLVKYGFVLALVGLALYFRHRRNQLRHETMRAMVDKGVPIPAELLSERLYRPYRDLRTGLILIGIGGGILLNGSQSGWIVLFIGVMFLIFWLVARGDKNNPPQGK